MVLADNPIEDDKDDKLKRAPLALKVSELIRNFRGKESFVIGIEGPWGAGKSSFLNLVIKDLNASKGTVILTFNPWNFTGQNELLGEFFSSLSLTLGDKLGKDVTNTFRTYATKLQVSFNPSIPVPFLGTIGLGELWKKGGTTLKEDREKIDDKLRSINRRIVIIIDDIDRLDKEETRLIMKLVKMTANFPNTIFLLAYDREKVCERLNEEGWPGEEYLKKIIQVSFTLPQPDQQQLLQILFTDLDDTIKGVYGEVRLEGENEKRWSEMLYQGFREMFKTVRDVKRYISSLRLNWSIIGKDEVNDVDFMGIEAIRVFAPAFYSAIASNKSLFTDTADHGIGSYSGNEKAEKATKYKELLEFIPKPCRPQMEGVVKVLFPQVDPQTSYGYEWQPIWRKEKRICSQEKFNFYFQLGIPVGEIPEAEATVFMQALEDQGKFSEAVLRLKEEGKLRRAFVKIMDRLDTLTEDQIKVLIGSFWNLEKTVNEEKTEAFDFDDVETWVGRLAYHSLKGLSSEDRLKVAEELLKNSKTLYWPLRFIAIEEEGLEAGRTQDRLFTREDLEKLKPIVVGRINEFVTDESILKEKSLVRILYIWKKWEGEEKVATFIEKLITTRVGVLSLLKGFVGTVLSSAGNYKRISKKTIAGLYPVEKIEALIDAITEEELLKMEAGDREAVDLFKNPSKDHLDD